MKRICLSVLICASICSVRAADVTQMDSTNMVGMTCFTSCLTNLPIGVTYGDYATTNVDMSVTNLIWTGNLVSDDQLYIYDYNQSRYVSMRLDSRGNWKAQAVDGGKPIDVTNDCFKAGKGAWLTRKNLGTREDKNVYTFGQVPVGQITVAIQAGGTTKATSTLVSYPRSEPLDLNGGAIDWSKVALDGDVIRVPQENGRMKDYIWDVDLEKWYVISGLKVVTTGLVVPRGVGFWYSRGAGNAATNLVWNVGSL